MTPGSGGGVANSEAGLGNTGSVPPGMDSTGSPLAAVTTLKAGAGSMITGSGSRLGLASPSKV